MWYAICFVRVHAVATSMVDWLQEPCRHHGAHTPFLICTKSLINGLGVKVSRVCLTYEPFVALGYRSCAGSPPVLELENESDDEEEHMDEVLAHLKEHFMPAGCIVFKVHNRRQFLTASYDPHVDTGSMAYKYKVSISGNADFMIVSEAVLNQHMPQYDDRRELSEAQADALMHSAVLGLVEYKTPTKVRGKLAAFHVSALELRAVQLS